MFEANIHKAKLMCEGYRFEDFSRIYTFTTENISGYIEHFDLKNKSLLTVGSSGDQILNAYYKGARDITLFDINEFTRYYTYLKIAAILCLDYKEFQQFFFKHGIKKYYNRKLFSKEMFELIKPTLKSLDYESFVFFNELFNEYKINKLRGNLFEDDESRAKVIMGYNEYLKNEESYNKLKFIIKSIGFKYVNGDIFKDRIEGKFDNIFLSNLCTVTDLEEFKSLLTRIDQDNLKENGSVLLVYLWNISFYSKRYGENWIDAYKIPLLKKILYEYITEHHKVKDACDILWNEEVKRDLVLIYRKK